MHRSKNDALMSELGLVSRVSPVHTAVRNCTRDEGWPFEVGNQVLISSHRKLLLSKANGRLDAWLDLGVSCVDDAKRRFSTRHQCKRGARDYPGRACCSTVAGSVKEKVEPRPGADSTQIFPPCSSTIRFEIASPRPVPPFLRVIALSAC